MYVTYTQPLTAKTISHPDYRYTMEERYGEARESKAAEPPSQPEESIRRR